MTDRIHRNRSGALASVALFTGILGTSAPAQAEDDGVIVLTLGAVSGAMAIPGVITIVGNSTDIGKNRKPSSGWRTGAFVMGGINLAGGAIFLGLIAPQGFGKIYAPALGFGMLNGVVGIMNIVIGGMATAMPDSQFSRIRVTPLPIADIRGQMVPGLGFQLRTY